ncbi:hypothetical protein LWF15_04775 [Kineosporia rhizophila]|uniref:hypothetical protein n=1 Tax=Kineosporia rhizophila TaxID=84633 RepID=UPI000AA047B7|nr:hypothetical protein [Kineosporia rhizophila]MCE0534815.1 hypothetical protein [Kineosporia rhizophila]
MPTTSPSLTLGGKIVAAAGLLFLVATFLPWYSFTVKAFGTSNTSSANGWDVGLAKVAALLVFVALAEVIVTQVAKVRLPVSPSLLGLGRLAVSGLAALLVLVELVKGQDLDMPDTSGLESLSAGLGAEVDLGIDYSFGRSFGMFAAVLFALLLVAGNVLRLRETPALTGPGQYPGQGQQQFGHNPQQAPYSNPQQQYGNPQQAPYGSPQQQYGNDPQQYNQQNQGGQPYNQNQYDETRFNPDGYGQPRRPERGQQYPPQQDGQY